MAGKSCAENILEFFFPVHAEINLGAVVMNLMELFIANQSILRPWNYRTMKSFAFILFCAYALECNDLLS